MRIVLLLMSTLLLVASCHGPQDRKTTRHNKNHEIIEQNDDLNETLTTGTNKIVVTKSDNDDVLSGQEIYKKYSKAVFLIYGDEGQGSAFFINKSGYAVSNFHVFEGNYNMKAKIGDYVYDIDQVYYDENKNYDFVIFHVDKNVTNTYIPIANKKPEIGEKAYAIGSPKGLENTFSSGEISQMNHYNDEKLIQINVPIDHGSSGGALLNSKGEVIGITTAGINSNANLNFALSIDVIKPYLRIRD